MFLLIWFVIAVMVFSCLETMESKEDIVFTIIVSLFWPLSIPLMIFLEWL